MSLFKKISVRVFELTDAGFDYSVLSEFRSRLIDGSMEEHILDLDTMLDALAARGLIGKREKQRTDSSHVVAAIRVLNRLENLGETLRAALNSLAVAAPQWLVQVAEPEWFDRYGNGKRIEESRLPKGGKGEAARKDLAETIGRDGMKLLKAIYSYSYSYSYSDDSPQWLGPNSCCRNTSTNLGASICGDRRTTAVARSEGFTSLYGRNMVKLKKKG